MIDLTGQKFGRLTVIEQYGRNKHNEIVWLCRCNCGKINIISSYTLRSGHTKSCGCLRTEKSRQRLTKHGFRKSKTYRTWSNIITRCTNPNYRFYKDYGGRDIRVCERWSGKNGFIHFLEDMGECPPGLTIDRINNNLGYYKENCRWIEQKQNNRNKRNNCLITYNDQTKSLPDWAEKLNINRETLWCRIFRYNWSIKKALTTTVRRIKPNE